MLHNLSQFKVPCFAFLHKYNFFIFKSDFRILADYLYQMRVNRDYIPEKRVVKHIDEILSLMSAMTGDTRYEETANEIENKEGVTMCEVLDRIEQRGIEKGIEQGIVKGIEQGMVKGRREGINTGADIISKLNETLIKEGDFDSLLKANTDKSFRRKLLKKYHLLKDFEL